MKKASDDQSYLYNTGIWIELLAEAFKSLPNLATIDIRDFDSSSRYRDGLDARWYSYGSTTIFKASSMRPVLHLHSHDEWNFLDRIFQGVVLAAARSGTNAPNLEVITRSQALASPFYVSAAVMPAVSAYLSKVTKLHLVLRSVEPEPIEAFLHLAHNVKWLRVNYLGGNNNPEKFLTWLSTPATNDTMVDYAKACAVASQDNTTMPIAPLNLPLDSLELGSCSIGSTALNGIVKKLPLRSLSLWRVQLRADPPFKAGNDGKLWKCFLASLEGSDIRRLTVGHATESSAAGVWGQKVTFKGGYDENQLKLPNRRYRNEMFRRAADDCEVQAPPASDNGDDEDDEDDDEDDEDDIGDNGQGGGTDNDEEEDESDGNASDP